jgi:hypothetical protein
MAPALHFSRGGGISLPWAGCSGMARASRRCPSAAIAGRPGPRSSACRHAQPYCLILAKPKCPSISFRSLDTFCVRREEIKSVCATYTYPAPPSSACVTSAQSSSNQPMNAGCDTSPCSSACQLQTRMLCLFQRYVDCEAEEVGMNTHVGHCRANY